MVGSVLWIGRVRGNFAIEANKLMTPFSVEMKVVNTAKRAEVVKDMLACSDCHDFDQAGRTATGNRNLPIPYRATYLWPLTKPCQRYHGAW